MLRFQFVFILSSPQQCACRVLRNHRFSLLQADVVLSSRLTEHQGTDWPCFYKKVFGHGSTTRECTERATENNRRGALTLHAHHLSGLETSEQDFLNSNPLRVAEVFKFRIVYLPSRSLIPCNKQGYLWDLLMPLDDFTRCHIQIIIDQICNLTQ